jgi:hypothetical protein
MPPRSPRGTRPFGVGDALILTSATGFGLAGLRFQAVTMFHMTLTDGWAWLARWVAVPVIIQFVTPMLLSWSIAVVWCGLRRPRPPLRRLWRRPGFLACAAACIPFAWKIATLSGAYLFLWLACSNTERMLDSGRPSPLKRLVNKFVYLLDGRELVAPIILFAWLVAWTSKGLRPEPTWLDQTGRVLGVVWLAFGMFHAVDALYF